MTKKCVLICVCMCISFILMFYQILNLHWSATSNEQKNISVVEISKIINDFRNWAAQQAEAIIQTESFRLSFLASTGALNNYTLAKGGQPMRTIIVTTFRSGSSFLGEILGSHPAAYYIFEPLFDLNQGNEVNPWNKDAVSVLKKTLNCDYANLSFNHGKNFLLRNKRLPGFCKTAPEFCWDKIFLERMCQMFPYQVVKTVRLNLSLARYLLEDEKLNVRVIHLVRDPRGRMQSCLELEWCSTQHKNVALHCLNLVQNYYVAEKLRKDFPDRFMVVRYEDLATNVYSTVKKILKFARLEYHSAIQSFLETHTTRNQGDDYSTFRDTKITAFRWIRDISGNFSNLEDIQNSCRTAMQLWGYKTAHNYSELMNNFNPLINAV